MHILIGDTPDRASGCGEEELFDGHLADEDAKKVAKIVKARHELRVQRKHGQKKVVGLYDKDPLPRKRAKYNTVKLMVLVIIRGIGTDLLDQYRGIRSRRRYARTSAPAAKEMIVLSMVLLRQNSSAPKSTTIKINGA